MKTVTHEYACLLGPKGQLCISLDGTWETLSDSDRSDLFCWASEQIVGRGEELVDWRRAVLHITVPVLGEQPKIGLVGTVEVKEDGDE